VAAADFRRCGRCSPSTAGCGSESGGRRLVSKMKAATSGGVAPSGEKNLEGHRRKLDCISGYVFCRTGSGSRKHGATWPHFWDHGRVRRRGRPTLPLTDMGAEGAAVIALLAGKRCDNREG